jgi:hypothetical protein
MLLAGLCGGLVAGCATHTDAPASPVFVDVAASAGINFEHVNGASGRYYYVETYGSGGAFLDADGDGFQDIYLVNSAALPGFEAAAAPTNALFRNDGQGGFVDVTRASGTGDRGYGMGSCAGDVDNDGDVDLYVTNYGPNVLYRNRGSGDFDDVTTASGTGDGRLSTSAAFADVDNDGDLDLYVANNAKVSLDDHEPCRRGDIPVYCAPTDYAGESGILYRNDGADRFSDATRSAGLYDASGRQLGVVFGDVDDDGDADLYVANDMTANFLFFNDGDGRFAEQGLISGVALSDAARPEAGMGTDLGDVDGDLDPDLLVCNFQWESCRLYRNEGRGSFTDVTFAAGLGEPTLRTLTFGTGFFDADNDGDLDIHLANGHVHPEVHAFDRATTHAQRDQLFHNDGVGSFTETTAHGGTGLEILRVGRGSAYADYDNDGDVDVLVSNNGQRPLLLRNDGGNRNHWLSVRTVGTLSNRDGIGARITVVAGDRVQRREVRSGSSYLAQNDMRAHFGLGRHAAADRVDIRWPSGMEQIFEGVASGVLIAVEPER